MLLADACVSEYEQPSAVFAAHRTVSADARTALGLAALASATYVTGEVTMQTEPPLEAEGDKLAEAAKALFQAFGPHAELEYLPGKTAFRDEICERLGVSLLEAEELCDALERTGHIVFHEPHLEDEEPMGWTIAEAVGE